MATAEHPVVRGLGPRDYMDAGDHLGEYDHDYSEATNAELNDIAKRAVASGWRPQRDSRGKHPSAP